MEREHRLGQMAPIFKVHLKETKLKDMVLRLGQINPDMKEISNKVGCKAKVKEHTKMVMFTKANSIETRDPVKVH